MSVVVWPVPARLTIPRFAEPTDFLDKPRSSKSLLPEAPDFFIRRTSPYLQSVLVTGRSVLMNGSPRL